MTSVDSERPNLADLPGRGRLASRHAVVTGAGSHRGGMSNGRATTLTLAREGAFVRVLDRDVDSAEETAQMVRDAGGAAQVHAVDVSDEVEVRRICAAISASRPVDILVNNVGVTGAAEPIAQLDMTEWDRVLRTNVTSAALMTKHLVPTMRAASAIVNLTSLAARRYTGWLPYAASKGAIEALTIGLAGQLGPLGIRVNAVCPGSVWTPLAAEDPGVRAVRQGRADATLLGQEGTAWDTAYAVCFLVGPEARWITGQILVVDGGASTRLPGVS